MNSYGFFINKSTDWWNLNSGYFCRDNPQLNKILPRPRSSRSTKSEAAEFINVLAPLEKGSPSDSSNSPAFETANESSVDSGEAPGITSLSSQSQLKKSDKKLKRSKGKESHQTRKATKRALDAVSKKEATAPKRSRSRMPHGTFPELLHKFICECSVSHPDVVSWNSNRTAFNVEIHHPTLPNLLSKYFQRE